MSVNILAAGINDYKLSFQARAAVKAHPGQGRGRKRGQRQLATPCSRGAWGFHDHEHSMLPLDLVRRAQWRMPDHQIDLLPDLETAQTNEYQILYGTFGQCEQRHSTLPSRPYK